MLSEGKQKTTTLPFIDEQKEQDYMVKPTTGLTILKLPLDISENNMNTLKKIIECEPHFPLSYIAVYPSLRQDRLEAVPLEDTGFNVLTNLADSVIPICELRNRIIKNICKITGVAPEPLLRFAIQHIKYLANTGILVIERINYCNLNKKNNYYGKRKRNLFKPVQL